MPGVQCCIRINSNKKFVGLPKMSPRNFYAILETLEEDLTVLFLRSGVSQRQASSASGPSPVCTVMWRSSGRAWQDYRYLEAASVLSVPSSPKIPSLKEPSPSRTPVGCQFVRQPDADPFRPPDRHPAEDLKNLEGQFFFPDI